MTSDAAELAALEGASEETADGAVEEVPQPAREAASSTVTTERESICLQRIEKYLNVSESEREKLPAGLSIPQSCQKEKLPEKITPFGQFGSCFQPFRESMAALVWATYSS